MNKSYFLLICCWAICLAQLLYVPSLRAQPCISPAKQVILYDAIGNYYLYWKPVTPPPVINYVVKIKCTNPSNCSFTLSVNASNVLLMNGGYLGVKIPALPGLLGNVVSSILPPNCPPEYIITPVYALDLVTDNLDISTASCDSDTCVLVVDTWKTLKKLNNYTVAKCGGAGGAIGASTVSAIDAPIEISLRKNAAGKWQIQTLDTVKCDSCYLFNFQITCGGQTYYLQEIICFNYTGPALGCRYIEEITDPFPFSIYPNPASDQCTLEIWLEEGADISITIYNSLGMVMSSDYSNEELEAGLHEIELSMRDFSQGMYIVEVRKDGEASRVKLLKF